MILSEVQMLTIERLEEGENYTIGGPAVDMDLRYEITRHVNTYSVKIIDQLIRRHSRELLYTPKEVIDYIQTK